MAWFAVLGEKLASGDRMSEMLKRRLNLCLRKFRRGDRVIVCGSNVCGSECTHSEAFVMRKYLVERGGVPRGAVVLENRSRDTRGNIRHLTRLCRDLGVKQLTIVSSYWHLPRVRCIVGRSALPEVCAVRFLASRDRVPPARMRAEAEYLASERLMS